jgi:rubrerythrin
VDLHVVKDRVEGIEIAGKPGKRSPEAVAKAKARTTDELLAAYKGEATASSKYMAYALKAEQEHYPRLALLFKAVAESEMIHVNNHKAVLKESGIKVPPIYPQYSVKSTRENLLDALKGETYEGNIMYLEFLIDADKAGNQLAIISFNYALKNERKHRVMFEKALAAFDSNTLNSLSEVYYVCITCGNTYDVKPLTRCGFCLTGVEKFIKIKGL